METSTLAFANINRFSTTKSSDGMWSRAFATNVTWYLNKFNSWVFLLSKNLKVYITSIVRKNTILTLQTLWKISKYLQIISNSNSRVGLAFCCFNDAEFIFSWKSRLQTKNFVFQEELKAIQEAIQWATNIIFSSFLINSDNLSSIMALWDLQTTNAMISEILQKIKKQSKKFFFNWVKRPLWDS